MKHKYKTGDRLILTKAKIAGGSNPKGERATFVEYFATGELMILPDNTKGAWPAHHPDFKGELLYIATEDSVELLKKEEYLYENT